jgi:hypothetical protein
MPDMNEPRHVLSIFLTLAVSSLAIKTSFADPPKSCATDSRLVAPCYTVHGRLSAWNGAPTFRIWVVGTKRILGVSEGMFGPVGYDLLPQGIPAPVSFDEGYFGDFTVCPFQPPSQNKMRLVCVAAVRHLRVAKLE